MSLVAIVGRPNVGKSTLFNRLVGERKAIVDATAGTTRDRHYGKTDWNGKEFSIIDTGGYTVNSEDIFEDEIRRQVLLAIDEADVILFLVEVRTGITDLDMLMADILRRTSKKVILVCNKVDNNDQIYSSHEFYALGLGDPYCISSMSGSGTGDLMDAILDALPVETASEEDEDLPHITIVGRPNVGKSSLTNALLGEERNLLKFTEQTAGELADSARSMWEDFTLPATPESARTAHGQPSPPAYARTDSYTPGFPLQFPLPGQSRKTSGYGWRTDPMGGLGDDFHIGNDLAAAQGTPVLAAADGVVRMAGSHKSYGNYLRILHADGDETLYAHMQYLFVKAGECVTAGQSLGTVGETGNATGPHLHFEILHRGLRYDPAEALQNAATRWLTAFCGGAGRKSRSRPSASACGCAACR